MRLSNWLMFATLFLAHTPEPSPSLVGIAHIAFRVTDVSKSRGQMPGKPEVVFSVIP